VTSAIYNLLPKVREAKMITRRPIC